jgi:hypothetical protein
MSAAYECQVNEAVERARTRANLNKKDYAVVLIDNGEQRVIKVMPNNYTYEEEFDAFNGKVICEVYYDP